MIIFIVLKINFRYIIFMRKDQEKSDMQIILNIPENVKLDCSEYDIKMYLAVALYEKGILDTGYAAKSIGMTRADFILEMGKYGESIFDISDEELKRDLENTAKFI